VSHRGIAAAAMLPVLRALAAEAEAPPTAAERGAT
jgi:hypothetical protein